MDTLILGAVAAVVAILWGLLLGLWWGERNRRRDWQLIGRRMPFRPAEKPPPPDYEQPSAKGTRASLGPFTEADRNRIARRTMDLTGVSRKEAEEDADKILKDAQSLGLL